MKIDYQDKIDRYIQGQMSENEIRDFEQELKANEELCDQLDYTQKVKRAITSHRDKMKLMKEWQNEHKNKKQKLSPYWISGIAAILIIGFFAINPYWNNDGINPDKHEIIRGTSNHSTLKGTGNDVFIPKDTTTTDSVAHHYE